MKKMSKDHIETICRVCGLDTPDEIHWEGVFGPSHDHCPCCKCQFGFHDDEYKDVIDHRNKWAAKGYPWLGSEKSKEKYVEDIDSWNPIEQMKNIPPEWR